VRRFNARTYDFARATAWSKLVDRVQVFFDLSCRMTNVAESRGLCLSGENEDHHGYGSIIAITRLPASGIQQEGFERQ
jgi:hypothetical protein